MRFGKNNLMHWEELILDPDFRAELEATQGTGDPFEHVMSLGGQMIRAVDGRFTFRFQLKDKSYFAKLHTGVPFRRIIRKIFQFRLPVLGAKPEWVAIHRLQALGISTPAPVAFGCRRKLNPALERSFVITRDLGRTITLEQECFRWRDTPPNFTFKVRLIREVARIARTLHADGMNHRDFYLCHFRLDLNHNQQVVREGRVEPCIYLMDLHRAQRHKRLSRRARIKDLGGLFFSALDVGLTKRDLLRFIQAYQQAPLHQTLSNTNGMWQEVMQRAIWQYKREHGRDPTIPISDSI